MIKNKLNPQSGNRLRDCITQKGITQKEFAKQAGYTAQYISNIIVGKKPLSIVAAMRFSSILGVSDDYLLCKSDYKTHEEQEDAEAEIILENSETLEAALYTLIKNAGYEIIGCYRDEKFEKAFDAMFNIHSNATEKEENHFLRPPELILKIKAPDDKVINVPSSYYRAVLKEIKHYTLFAMKHLSETIQSYNFSISQKSSIGEPKQSCKK